MQHLARFIVEVVESLELRALALKLARPTT
jgi:hypothetical protein